MTPPPWQPLRILPPSLTLDADTYDLRGWGALHGVLRGEVRIERGEWQALTVTLARQDDNIAGTLTIGATAWEVRGWHKADGVVCAEVRPLDWAWWGFERGLLGRVEG